MSAEDPTVKLLQDLHALISTAVAPDWFTEDELAKYLRLVDKDGNPKTAGIKVWVKRPADENPLPRRYLGDLPRFFRPDVLRWTEEETRRQENKTRVRNNGVLTVVPDQDDNSGALTAAAS